MHYTDDRRWKPMLSMLMTTEYAPAEDRHELQQLLIHIAGGEREALAELYQRTRSAVYGLALSYLKNAQDAQDLTQDVYVQVWDRAEQYQIGRASCRERV